MSYLAGSRLVLLSPVASIYGIHTAGWKQRNRDSGRACGKFPSAQAKTSQRLRARSLESELRHPRFERGCFEPKSFRGATDTADAPTGCLEDRPNVLFL